MKDRRGFLQQVAGGAGAFALAPELLGHSWSSEEKVRVGVVGVGRWGGRPLLTELTKFGNVELVGLADTNSAAVRKAKRRAPDAASLGGHQELLDAGVDAVFVCTPTHRHRAIAEACLDAGVHVYCEAPMAHTVEDLKAMAELASRSSKVFQVGHLARSNPVYKLARSFVRSGALRELLIVKASSHQKNRWTGRSGSKEEDWKLYRATSSGLPGELGSHQFDAVMWFSGKVPTTVRGSGHNLGYADGREQYDSVECNLGFENGLRLLWDATLANSFESEVELYAGQSGTIKTAATHGWMFKEADAAQQGWEVYANRQKFHKETGITLIADATKLAGKGQDLSKNVGLPDPPLFYGIESFLKSILEGAKVSCTAADGLAAGVVALRAQEAVLSGSQITIDPSDLKLS